MTQIKGVYNATAPTVRDRQNEDIQLDVNGNLKQTLATALDKTNDSITNYPVGCNHWVMDCSDNTDDAVSAGAPAILVGVYVSVAIATNPVVLYDGTTAIATLPTCAAGTYFQFPNVICATSLIANPADDTTGTITIFWRAL